jgi:hypothetical protein
MQHSVEPIDAILIGGEKPGVTDESLAQERDFWVEILKVGFPGEVDCKNQLSDGLVVVELLEVHHNSGESQRERRGVRTILPELMETKILNKLKHFIIGHNTRAREDVVDCFRGSDNSGENMNG